MSPMFGRMLRPITPLQPWQRLVAALGGNNVVPAFYDAAYGITLASGQVSEWDDARGATGFGPKLLQPTPANQPGYGSGLVTFNGTVGDQYLATAGASALFDPSAGTGLTMVAIGALNAPNSGDTLAALSGAGGNTFVIQTFSGDYTCFGGDSQVHIGTAIRLALTSGIVGDANAIQVAAQPRVGGPFAPSAGANQLFVGCNAGLTGFAVLDLAALFFMNRDFTPTDVTNCETYAATKSYAPA